MPQNIKQIKYLQETFDKKLSSLYGINSNIEQDILYPEKLNYNGVKRIVSNESELLAAITASKSEDIIELSADIIITSTFVINKSVKITGDYIIQSTADANEPVVLISVTANDVCFDSGLTIKHRKTTNTSVEVAVSVVAERFISEANVEFMEFGYQLKGSYNISGKTTYTGTLLNSHRHICVYKLTNNSIIHDLVYDSPSEVTAYANIIATLVVGDSTFDANLKVSNVTPKTKTNPIRQFYYHEVFTTAGNPSVIFEGNYFNDVNGGIGFVDTGTTISVLDFFDYMAFIGNVQGNAGSASYKGIVYVSGSGTAVNIGNCRIYAANNISALTELRSDYTPLMENTLIGYKTSAFTTTGINKELNAPIENSIYNFLIGCKNTTEINKIAIYTVTTGTTAGNSTLTLVSGAISNGGASTKTKDRIDMVSETIFNKNSFIVELNGVTQLKGTDVSYSSSGIITIVIQLDAGDIITIKDYA